jgi:hypothetical protein
MLESAWLFVGRIAFVWTLVTVGAAVYVDSRDESGDALATVAGALGVVMWGVWTYASLGIEVVDGGTTVTFEHPELTILGVAMALVPAYIALTGPIELVNRYRQAGPDDL